MKKENIHTFKTIKAKKVVLKSNYDYFSNNFFRRIISALLIIFLKLIIVPITGTITKKLRYKYKENLKLIHKKPCILVANHVLQADAFYIGTKLFPSRVLVTMLESNLGIPFAGKFFRLAGGVPIPSKKENMIKFDLSMTNSFKRNEKILVYPESSLIPYCDHIRDFKLGAFRWSIINNVPILPIVTVFKKPQGIYKFRKKGCVEIHFLKPIEKIQVSETAASLRDRTWAIMKEYFDLNSDYKSQEDIDE